MNQSRRKRISEALSTLEAVHAQLEELATEERDYYDNMSESVQSGEKGQKADEDAGNLEAARDGAQEALNALGNIEL